MKSNSKQRVCVNWIWRILLAVSAIGLSTGAADAQGITPICGSESTEYQGRAITRIGVEFYSHKCRRERHEKRAYRDRLNRAAASKVQINQDMLDDYRARFADWQDNVNGKAKSEYLSRLAEWKHRTKKCASGSINDCAQPGEKLPKNWFYVEYRCRIYRDVANHYAEPVNELEAQYLHVLEESEKFCRENYKHIFKENGRAHWKSLQLWTKYDHKYCKPTEGFKGPKPDYCRRAE